MADLLTEMTNDRKAADDEDQTPARGMDSELKSMSAIIRILEKFDSDALAQQRIVDYIAARYSRS